MVNFWETLPRPFLVLAPMEDVTDMVFREIVATKLPRPDIFFTEFTSSDGLCSKGYKRVVQKLKFSENQRPIAAQLWGNDPEKMLEAARIVQDLGFNELNINMGCPERSLVKKGCGAGLIGIPDVASSLIEAAKKGAPKLPITVKTRIGIKSVITNEWIGHLLKQDIAALTIHGRTASQMSDGQASWEEIEKAVKLRDEISPKTIIIGNGDVKSREEAVGKAREFGVDGVMIGRGIFHNPWVFEKAKREHSKQEKLQLLSEHARLFVDVWGKSKNFEILKKFFKMYCKEFDDAVELRIKLMACKNLEEVEKVISEVTYN